MVDTSTLQHLDARERDCLQRYVTTVAEQLGANLVQVWLFGSAARGDMWSDTWPQHSDIDLLVLTNDPTDSAEREHLINETYPLFLECGRQIVSQFQTTTWFATPEDERQRDFVARVQSEGRIIYQG